ncbi:hypothetical protein L7F22_022430 [Adiantum nelumboides]|nr:hypothetical protein [Adiantum nelumboides]
MGFMRSAGLLSASCWFCSPDSAPPAPLLLPFCRVRVRLLPFPPAIHKTWFGLSARLSLAISDKGSWNSLTIACSSCNELVAVEEWESHSLMHEIQAGELKSIRHKNDVKCDEGELAWAFGFDEPGAEFFQFRIHGSKEWIGTSECATLFRSFGLRARIVDFSAAGENARKKDVSHEALVKWVWIYFTDGIKDAALKKYMDLSQGHVSTSCRSPLYFQHQGHSRTIVGIQHRKKSVSSKEEVFLLVLDPSNVS